MYNTTDTIPDRRARALVFVTPVMGVLAGMDAVLKLTACIRPAVSTKINMANDG